MANIQIFLSAVSAEFGSYRESLRRDLARPNVTVKVQEDFGATGTETLDKLDTYIKECDAVVHLVGDMTGASAQEPSVQAVRRRYPDFSQRFAVLSPNNGCVTTPLSYTQWEAWLALYHGKPLIIAVPLNGAPRDASYRHDIKQQAAQKAHLARLASVERYPEIHFGNADRLGLELHRSSLQEILSAAQGTWRRLLYYGLLLLAGLSCAGALALSAERKLFTNRPLLSGTVDVLDALAGSVGFGVVVLARFASDILRVFSPNLWTETGIPTLKSLWIIVGALAVYLVASVVLTFARSSARYMLPILLTVPAALLAYRVINFDVAVSKVANIIDPSPVYGAREKDLLDAFVCSRISKSDVDRGKISFAAPRCHESIAPFDVRYKAESVVYAFLSFAEVICIIAFHRIRVMPHSMSHLFAVVYLFAVVAGLGNWYGRYRPNESYTVANLSLKEHAKRNPPAEYFIVQRGWIATQVIWQISQPCGASLVDRDESWEWGDVASRSVASELNSQNLIKLILLSNKCPVIPPPQPSPRAG